MTRLVTVFAGPLWEAQLLLGRLEVEAIPATIPDATVKQLDPFITGANALDFTLQVRAEDHEAAAELVTAHLAATRDAAAQKARAEADPEEARREGVRKLGIRTRWASLLTVTAPIALVLGFLYLRTTRDPAVRPAGHGLTVAAFGYWSVVAVGLVTALLAGWLS